jgi:MoaA/NifB/PqqE/SkfB family radical SAM enzyme
MVGNSHAITQDRDDLAPAAPGGSGLGDSIAMDKDLFDLLGENQDNYFMMYTNGTLITREVAERMADLGNISPAISVEGWERETDDRRGKGVFRRVQEAMQNLRAAGVPFGISVTATRENAEVILSESFLDFYFGHQGALYGWIFQYMPIGRGFTADWMVTPEQRRWMLEQELTLLRDKKRFLVDFWNGGPMTLGCIAAGRPGGYFYVDWNGNIAPCVFFPYYVDNLYGIYANNLSLTDVLESGFFQTIIETGDLGSVEPSGTDVFQKGLHGLKDLCYRLIFHGKHAPDLAPAWVDYF